MSDSYILALPKGRILEQILPILSSAGLTIEDSFFDKKTGAFGLKRMILVWMWCAYVALMWRLSSAWRSAYGCRRQ